MNSFSESLEAEHIYCWKKKKTISSWSDILYKLPPQTYLDKKSMKTNYNRKKKQ